MSRLLAFGFFLAGLALMVVLMLRLGVGKILDPMPMIGWLGLTEILAWQWLRVPQLPGKGQA